MLAPNRPPAKPQASLLKPHSRTTHSPRTHPGVVGRGARQKKKKNLLSVLVPEPAPVLGPRAVIPRLDQHVLGAGAVVLGFQLFDGDLHAAVGGQGYVALLHAALAALGEGLGVEVHLGRPGGAGVLAVKFEGGDNGMGVESTCAGKRWNWKGCGWHERKFWGTAWKGAAHLIANVGCTGDDEQQEDDWDEIRSTRHCGSCVSSGNARGGFDRPLVCLCDADVLQIDGGFESTGVMGCLARIEGVRRCDCEGIDEDERRSGMRKLGIHMKPLAGT